MSVRLSYVVSNMRNEMKCCLSVCHTWFPIWGMKWNVCPSQSYVDSNMRNEMKCLSVSVIRGFQYEEWNEMSVRLSHTWFPIWGMKWNVCPSVIRGFQYEEWDKMLSVRLSHTWFPIWGMKWNVCPSVIHGFQYQEWNKMSVSLGHAWVPIWGMK